jgi:tetratricopeptide (TPR) repeat protein
MQAAEKLVARGKISQAIREYRKLLRDNPNDANMLNRVGDLFARQDKVDEAVALFRKIANAYGGDGFFVKAIAIYKKIIRLDPTQLDVYEHLAGLYHRQGLVSEARSQYQVLADYYQKHGDTAATIEIHRKMADLEPGDPSPRVRLAELYLSQGLLEETIGEYQRIAELMLDHERVAEATKVYLRALDLDSGDLAFVSEAVMRLREEGHHEAAATVLEAAIERNPEVAKLAERMREHAEAATAAAEAAPEVVSADEREARDPDSVDLAEVIGDADLAATQSAAPRRAPPRRASPIETAADGAFVIDLDQSAEEILLTEVEDEVEEELEIDLSELEAGEVAPPSRRNALASIDALAASVGASGNAGAAAPAANAPPAAEAPPTAAPARHTELAELLAEAEVFAKYGLESKALRRLQQALDIEPTHFETHRRLVLLHLKRGVEADVVAAAQQLLDLAAVGGGAWEGVLRALTEAGYIVEDDGVRRGAAAPATERAAADVAAEAKEDEGLEWLAEAARAEEDIAEAVFDVEEEFFDLAAELEKELAAEEASRLELETEAPAPRSESLEDIVQGFKKGVAEVLSPEAYDTHYNLGIAYREMGLVDEAIGEFQLAAKDRAHLVDSCSMLGACFLEKGFPDLAVKWYRKGLESPDIDEEGSLSLLYDLGSVHAVSGDRENAYEIFVEIYGINSHYRDVVARLEELRGG